MGKEAINSRLNFCQVFEWLDLDRDFGGGKVPHGALTHYCALALANREFGLACLVHKAEVGHVGFANTGWRS